MDTRTLLADISDELTLARAKANLESGEVIFALFSGKMASGKDSVASATMKALGRENADHLSYAAALKDELNAIMGTIRNSKARRDARHLQGAVRPLVRRKLTRLHFAALVAQVCEMHDLKPFQAQVIIRAVLPELRRDPSLNAYSRTPGIRRALQYLGTDVRRAVDTDYWAKKALCVAVEALAAGRDVYCTDARFPNEVSLAALVGARTVRLDIPAELQEQRLFARDGIKPSEEALNHESETALDDYDSFDLRMDNTGAFEVTVEIVVQALDTSVAA